MNTEANSRLLEAQKSKYCQIGIYTFRCILQSLSYGVIKSKRNFVFHRLYSRLKQTFLVVENVACDIKTI
jgi:hypothetical protein